MVSVHAKPSATRESSQRTSDSNGVAHIRNRRGATTRDRVDPWGSTSDRYRMWATTAPTPTASGATRVLLRSRVDRPTMATWEVGRCYRG